MERLSVNNFLGIKQADLEVAKFTVIIGPQASGKSVLAKLVHFFRENLLLSLDDSLSRPLDMEEIDNQWSQQFYAYFPAYSWGDGSFEILYRNEKFVARIVRVSKSQQLNITMEGFRELHSEVDASIAAELPVAARDKILKSNIARSAYSQRIVSLILKKIGQSNPLFIPAGRSFLSILQRNAFTVFRDVPDIDPFMWALGARLEQLKRSYAVQGLESGNDHADLRVQELIDTILVGKYRHSEDQDWIDVDGRTVRLSHASSGQQEVLPMLLLLASPQTRRDRSAIIIEEPEAHLFPDSQRHIVRLLALLQRQHGMQFLVTTHSPYILTALNNLIIAEEVSEKFGEDSVRDVVGGGDFLVSYEDVRAYTIQDGRLVSILDEESRLIGVNVIDRVSEVLSDEFDRLLDLRYQGATGEHS